MTCADSWMTRRTPTAGVPGLADRVLQEDRQLFTRIVRTKLGSVTSRRLAAAVDRIIQVGAARSLAREITIP